MAEGGISESRIIARFEKDADFFMTLIFPRTGVQHSYGNIPPGNRKC